jgi:hypothetical protein
MFARESADCGHGCAFRETMVAASGALTVSRCDVTQLTFNGDRGARARRQGLS